MTSRRSLFAITAVAVGVGGIVTAQPVDAVPNPTSTVFINELHYDNVGADAGEFIEVAGPAGTALTGWSLVLYNGNGGASYLTIALAGSFPDQAGGYGTVSVNAPGLQNGSPDGVALVGPSANVVQFLSYEGAFAATNGPANTLTSTDIGVSQPDNAPVGSSLQLTGNGTTYGDFTWASPATATPGLPNTGQTFGGGGTEPVATCPATLTTRTGTAASAPVSATDADDEIVEIAITSTPVPGITVADLGDGQGRLDVDATTAAGEYPVAIQFTNDATPPETATCTVQVSVEPPPPLTLVSAVQGSGTTSPIVGQDVTVEAVVTTQLTFQDGPDGFFVQEEDADADGDAATSEGLFVFCRGGCPDVDPGDLVRIDGAVSEFSGSTQITATPAIGTITILSSDNPLPSAAAIALPAATPTDSAATFESTEGMHTTFPAELTVSEYFNLARFGEVVLYAGGRPHQFTHGAAPDVDGYDEHLADLATRRIVLDDDNNDQNDAITGTTDEPYPYPTGGLAIDNRFRGGDTVTDLDGVLEWAFGAWRVRPIAGVDYEFEAVNEATDEPDDVGGDLRVASFNVLNSFSTVDTTSSNDVGECAPSGEADCRGADSTAELERQRAKIVAALTAIDADVVGLIEIQNDEGQTTQDIVDALNAVPGGQDYAAIETGFIGTDAIKVAFIYQPVSVEPVGDFAVLDSSDDPLFIDVRNRPALIQTFEQIGTDERFTVAINHFKSKGSACLPDDPDRDDGQGNCAQTRTDAARALADHLATDPTGSGDPDFLILGDLNSYRMETPITTLTDAGYVDLIAESVGADAYGYLFDGQLGYLDHALANGSMSEQVTGATEWHINADEVPLFDYNDSLRDPGERDPFERESRARELYEPTPARSSDHDPVVVGLDLPANALTIDEALIVARRNGGGSLVFTGTTDAAPAACPTLDLRVEGAAVMTAALTPLGSSSVCAALTSRGLLTYDLMSGSVAGVLALPSAFRLADSTITFDLGIDGDRYVQDRAGQRLGLIWIAT